MKKALVTGAGGFIGHHLVSYLVKKGFWVRAVDIKRPEFEATKADEYLLLDLRDERNCHTSCKGMEYIFHLAADMGGIGYISGSHASIAVNDTQINIGMLNAARDVKAKRFFFSSTACVYPLHLQKNPDVISLREDLAHPAQPEEGYGWEKLYTEKLCEYYRSEYGLETRIGRFHNVYGPMGTYDGGKEKAPAATCRKVALAKNGGEIEVWGDGEQTRSFMYIDDCIEGVYRFTMSDFPGPINIGTEELVTINDLCDMTAEIAGKKLTKKHDLSRPQGVRGRNSDNTLIRKVLRWEPKTSLKVGLAETYRWIEAQVQAQFKVNSQRMSDRERIIAIIGLGKLGSPMAACFASKGYAVIGADLDENKVNAINQGRAPVREPGLDELIKKSAPKLKATSSIRGAAQASDLIFLIVPTPSNELGEFSNDYLIDACHEVGMALRDHDRKPIVIVTSTVMPGAMSSIIRRTLETVSGKTTGVDFGLCYSPEFIALGSVIHDFLHPDFYLIGESDPETGERLEAFYQTICSNSAPVVRMSMVSAELAKIALNSFVTTKISFANTLSRLCEQYPDAHVDDVCRALGMDSRIGKKYLKGSVSFGGPCFPRDNIAFSRAAAARGVQAWVADGADRVNNEQDEILSELVVGLADTNQKIGILGISYKPFADVVERSAGLALAKYLAKDGYTLNLYDPMVLDQAMTVLEGKLIASDSVEECIANSDVIVIATPWPQFADHAELIERCIKQKKYVVDCWRMFESRFGKGNPYYVALGVGAPVSAAAISKQRHSSERIQ